MYGNAAEWVIDGYAKRYKLPKRQPVPAAEAIVWPTELYPRVVRGGSYLDDAKDARSAARLASNKQWQEQDPELPTSFWWETEYFMGFRIVRPLHPPTRQEMERFWEVDIEWVRKYLRRAQGERHKRVLITPFGR